jgi:hypothetical protein
MCSGVNLENGHPKKSVYKRDRTQWSECANHSRLNDQHDLGPLYKDHVMNTRIFTLIMKKTFYMSSENHDANDQGHNLDLSIISHYLHASYPTRSRCREIR